MTQLAVACTVEMVNASHHLSVLKGSGLVTVERDGRFMRYTLVGARVSGTTLTLTHPSGVKVVIQLG